MKAIEDDKKLKTFEQVYMEMVDSKMKSIKGFALDDENVKTGSKSPRLTPRGEGRKTPRAGEGRKTPTRAGEGRKTPRGTGGSTTPRGYRASPFTPSGAAVGTPGASAAAGANDGSLSARSENILKNENDLPVEEFGGFLTNLD